MLGVMLGTSQCRDHRRLAQKGSARHINLALLRLQHKPDSNSLEFRLESEFCAAMRLDDDEHKRQLEIVNRKHCAWRYSPSVCVRVIVGSVGDDVGATGRMQQMRDTCTANMGVKSNARCRATQWIQQNMRCNVCIACIGVVQNQHGWPLL